MRIKYRLSKISEVRLASSFVDHTIKITSMVVFFVYISNYGTLRYMFGNKELRQENERLRAENERLQAKLGRIANEIANDPIHKIVEDTRNHIKDIVEDNSIPISRIPSAIGRLIIRNSSKNLTPIERVIISSEASAKLRDLLETFDDEPAHYIDGLVEQSVENISNSSDTQQMASLEQALKNHANLSIDSAPSSGLDLKERAKSLREKTKDSHILPLEWLQENDQMTLFFAKEGRAFDSPYERYSGLKPTERSVSLQLQDAKHGIVSTVSDSWLQQSHRRDSSMRSGQSGPALVKGMPIELLGDDMEPLGESPESLHLWYVNLGKFRAMS